MRDYTGLGGKEEPILTEQPAHDRHSAGKVTFLLGPSTSYPPHKNMAGV